MSVGSKGGESAHAVFTVPKLRDPYKLGLVARYQDHAFLSNPFKTYAHRQDWFNGWLDADVLLGGSEFVHRVPDISGLVSVVDLRSIA